MYQVGDAVLYRQNGVCRIDDVQTLNLTGDGSREYFLLKPLYRKGMTVYVETEDADDSLKEPMSREAIDQLILELPSLPSDWIAQDKERASVIAGALRDGDIRQMLQRVKMLYERRQSVKRGGRKFSSADENYLHRLEDIINRELAFGIGVEPDEVPGYIFGRLAEQA